jgi:hypothetical protein
MFYSVHGQFYPFYKKGENASHCMGKLKSYASSNVAVGRATHAGQVWNKYQTKMPWSSEFPAGACG